MRTFRALFLMLGASICFALAASSLAPENQKSLVFALVFFGMVLTFGFLIEIGVSVDNGFKEVLRRLT